MNTNGPIPAAYRDLIAAIAKTFGVEVDQLLGHRRHATFVQARQACMYLLVRDAGLSSAEVGRMLGGRDHTTVLHGVLRAAQRLEEPTYRTWLTPLSEQAKGLNKANH